MEALSLLDRACTSIGNLLLRAIAGPDPHGDGRRRKLHIKHCQDGYLTWQPPEQNRAEPCWYCNHTVHALRQIMTDSAYDIAFRETLPRHLSTARRHRADHGPQHPPGQPAGVQSQAPQADSRATATWQQQGRPAPGPATRALQHHIPPIGITPSAMALTTRHQPDASTRARTTHNQGLSATRQTTP